MNNRIDPLIARIALSMYASGKRVERLPRITEVQPWEMCTIAGFDASQINARKGVFCGSPVVTYEGI